MSTRMHLLLQVDPGRAREVIGYLLGLPQVVDTAHTSGPYDVIATLEGSVQQGLSQVRRAPGLAVLRKCAAIEPAIPSATS
jgi:hypothetical protein